MYTYESVVERAGCQEGEGAGEKAAGIALSVDIGSEGR